MLGKRRVGAGLVIGKVQIYQVCKKGNSVETRPTQAAVCSVTARKEAPIGPDAAGLCSMSLLGWCTHSLT